MIEKLLAEIKEIDDKLESLKSEKEVLRQKIVDAMNDEGLSQKFVELPSGQFKIAKRHVTSVKYDEEVLRKRLGEKVKLILDIDYRKVRQHKTEVLNLLGDKLLDVGKVSQIRVKDAVASGELSSSDFKGAFEKKVADRITISKVQAKATAPSVDAPY